MTEKMTISTTISRLLTNQQFAPIPLTDRWGTFHEADNTSQYWLAPAGYRENSIGDRILETLTTLRSLFDTATGTLLGDPRRYMDSSEDSFVAVRVSHDGHVAIGIHHEMELDTDGCDDEQCQDIAQSWRGELDRLAELFPHTMFYAAFGEFTYNRRVTINAFTPLYNGNAAPTAVAPSDNVMLMSPYLTGSESKPAIESCTKLANIPEVLREMIYNDRTADDAVKAASNALLDPATI